MSGKLDDLVGRVLNVVLIALFSFIAGWMLSEVSLGEGDLEPVTVASESESSIFSQGEHSLGTISREDYEIVRGPIREHAVTSAPGYGDIVNRKGELVVTRGPTVYGMMFSIPHPKPDVDGVVRYVKIEARRDLQLIHPDGPPLWDVAAGEVIVIKMVDE